MVVGNLLECWKMIEQTISEIMTRNVDENPYVGVISNRSNLVHYGRYNRLPSELIDATVIDWWAEVESDKIRYYFIVSNLGSLEE